MRRALQLYLLCLLVVPHCDGKNVIFSLLPQTVLDPDRIYCETIASGRHLTSDLACLTLARESLVGYIERVVGADGVTSCLQCGILHVGVLTANTPGKVVWMDEGLAPAQALPMTAATGSVLEGTNLRATKGSGATIQYTEAGWSYLQLSATDSCITVDSSMILRDFKAITVAFYASIIQSAEDLAYLLAMTTTIHSSQFTLEVRYNSTSYILDATVTYMGNEWSVKTYIDILMAITITDSPLLAIVWSPAEGLVLYSRFVKQAEDKAPTTCVERAARPPTFIIGCGLDEEFPAAVDLSEMWIWDNVRDELYWSEYENAYQVVLF